MSEEYELGWNDALKAVENSFDVNDVRMHPVEIRRMIRNLEKKQRKVEHKITFTREEDGRWRAEIKKLPGGGSCFHYGDTKEEARWNLTVLAVSIETQLQ